MADAPDTDAERRLGEAREREAQTLSRREGVTRGVFAAGFVAAAAALAALAPTDRHAPWWAYAAAVLAYAAAYRVRFEVATGVALPTVVVLVPMLFLLPARDVPLAVLVSVVLTSLVDAARERRPLRRAGVVAAASSWFALGPALVFVAAGEPAPTGTGAAIVAAAILAQLACDAATATAGEWFALRIHPRELLRPLRDAFAIDLLLAPVGYAAVLAHEAERWALLVPAPVLLLLIVFARERSRGLDRVLDLLDEVRAQHAATEQALARSLEVEHALREADDRFRQLVDAIPEVFFLFGLEPHETLYVSPPYECVWGRPAESALARADAWLDGVHPDDRARTRRELAGATRGRVESSFRVVRPDGNIRWVVQQLFPVRNADGRVIRIAGVARDLSEQRTLEEQLRQSQKMEAVGQLAGGVAHDFNNLLTVIKGYAELSLQRVDSDVREDLREVVTAAERASALTTQILAFSRRQVLAPEVISLNHVVRETEGLVRRLLGADIAVRFRLADDLGDVLADAGQIGQVVMNLAINARDAMPAGGLLTISTENVDVSEDIAAAWELAPGPYARLTVRDTGTGMTAETSRRIFEPFFTTKDPGKGTGLGLSTCYGIVKQSGGHIDVATELGRGTAFDLYFPLTDEAAAARAENPLDDGGERSNATVLVVDDTASVLELSRRMLARHGFDVRTASSPTQALEIWSADGPFDALVTDLAMPGMSGRALVRRLGDLGPLPAVVLVSGYDAASSAEPPADAVFLQKPFSDAELAAAVRAAISARTRGGATSS